MTKSEEWDIKEENLDKQSDLFKKFKSDLFKKFESDKGFRNQLREAMDLYALHKKPDCKFMHLIILNELRPDKIFKGLHYSTSKYDIKILECRTCGWNYHKNGGGIGRNP